MNEAYTNTKEHILIGMTFSNNAMKNAYMRYGLNSPSYTSGKLSFSTIKSYINAYQPMSIVGYNSSTGGRHAFVLYGWGTEGSTNMISLRNPWYTHGTTIDYSSSIIPTKESTRYSFEGMWYGM